jgi:small nuclear ribonucleoprotein (snRNP)-like protein
MVSSDIGVVFNYTRGDAVSSIPPFRVSRRLRHHTNDCLFYFVYRKIFLSFFKTLVGKEIAVELKNDVVLTGTLHSVDQYLNVKLLNVTIVNPEKYPQLVALKNCFVRGSVVGYIQIPPEHVDTELLQDAARKENAPATTK